VAVTIGVRRHPDADDYRRVCTARARSEWLRLDPYCAEHPIRNAPRAAL